MTNEINVSAPPRRFSWQLNSAGLRRGLLSVLRPLAERVHERRFSRSRVPGYRGIYPDFASAYRSAPKTKPLGFNTQEYAEEFGDRLDCIFSYDYPVLFWMRDLLRPGSKVFDFGGHAGTYFYSYAGYLTYPSGLNWVVCDLPKILEAGRDLARKRNVSGLFFTSDFAEAEDADILIAAGSVQYIETPDFATLLGGLHRRPRHLLLNKLPLYGGPPFVTLQNGGVAFHPQHVFNHDAFVEDLIDLGYELVDEWSVEARPGRIPLRPEKSFTCHSGIYLRLRNGADR